VPSPTTLEAFAAFVNDERSKWQEVVKTAGVTVN
jgi:tripartite-type tricarboxylate transporter receptor subunit TctC